MKYIQPAESSFFYDKGIYVKYKIRKEKRKQKEEEKQENWSDSIFNVL
jgi:hypothetical protein